MIYNPYQPKTGRACSCRRGVQRDNCPTCEGTGQVVDFLAIRRRAAERIETKTLSKSEMTDLLARALTGQSDDPKQYQTFKAELARQSCTTCGGAVSVRVVDNKTAACTYFCGECHALRTLLETGDLTYAQYSQRLAGNERRRTFDRELLKGN